MIFKIFIATILMTSYGYAQFFYSNNKRIYVKPSFQNRSLNSNQSLFIINSTNESVGVYKHVLFGIKNKTDLQILIKKYNLKNVENIQGNTYTTQTDTKNVFSLSNKLHNDFRISFAHPDFYIKIKTKSLEKNPLSMYAGFLRAIEIEKLWNIAPKKGKNVNVAIIDTAIETSHLDLKQRVAKEYISSLSTVAFGKHGTNCAGVILGSDNYVGSVGVAPEANLYAVALNNRLSELIKSINWLVDKDISILSNSWGTMMYDALTNSLKNLAENGRDGKGTIILFAAGNSARNFDEAGQLDDQSELDFVLGVGAVDESGKKAKYSNYGEKIDIYAFGGGSLVGLMTTDLHNSYTATFGGTSAATPLVAGIVSLMLSIDPDLTFKDVKKILQDTADLTPAGLKKLNALKAITRTKELKDELEDELTAKKDDLIIKNTKETTSAKLALKNIEKSNLKYGWNMVGTTYDLSAKEILEKWPDAIIYSQNKLDTSAINYKLSPKKINAGEGFWIYKDN